jgi:hypothetical protein
MYNSFGLFFFWRKCSTVVAVGVQTSFLPFAKSVTEKNNSRVDCAEADKKTVQALRFGMLIELTRKGGDFWRPGITLRELPAITFRQSLTA